MGKCGKLFPRHAVVDPEDDLGCLLNSGHSGPCYFIDQDSKSWMWEVDMGCDCESCESEDPHDWCVVYWRAFLSDRK